MTEHRSAYACRCGSRPLDAREKRALGPYFAAVDLDAAILHETHVPWYLAAGFSAITRGRHIYFRPGGYRAGTVAGLALLGHELVHVGQYRAGMNALKYLLASWRGYRKNRYEIPAFAVQACILRMLSSVSFQAHTNGQAQTQ
jgi:hypothetical protein